VSLVQSVTIGFIVAVTSNVASAYQTAYGFQSYQTGLCFFAAIIGALVGIFCGGHLGDMTADFFTKRNGGIREPEMRLPAMMFCLISTPLSLILYGVGIQNHLHWMCPTVGLALLNFSIVQGTNVALVYVIDAYRPIVGEVTLTTMGFKCTFPPPLLFSSARNIDTDECSGIRLPPLLLHQPLDREIRILECLRSHGRNFGGSADHVGAAVHLGKEDQTCDVELVVHELRALG